MDADERTKTFETRIGNFVMKRETAMDQLRIGKRRRSLLGGDADAVDWGFAHQMAGIDILAEVKPDTLPVDRKTGYIDWDSVYDIDVVVSVWQDYQDWENSFLRPDNDSGDEGEGSGEESVDGVLRETVSKSVAK